MTPARAMTLVEVLAALAILVVLSGGVVGFFFGVTDRRDQLVRLAAQQRDAASLLDRLEAALTSAIAVAPDGSAGVRGGETSLAIATRSVCSVLEGDAAAADAAMITFTFNEAGAVCDCSLTPLLAGDQGAPGSVAEPILGRLERMRFRYLEGRRWVSSFDSLAAGGLPVAIEISLWFEPRTGPRMPEPPRGDPGGDPVGGLAPDDEDSPFGPLDLPIEADEIPWTPREPDHVRVMIVPDAPAMGRGGPSS